MDVAKFIKEAFLFLGLAVLGAILYTWLLAYPDGALWKVSENIQTPISIYYNQYCYVPNMHQSDYIDSKLGLKQNWGVYNTPSNIENADSVTYPSGVCDYSTDCF